VSEIWTMGEILVEIMRAKPDVELFQAAEFLGPYPSGAPAIFIDTAARLGHPSGIIGGVGADDFGKCLIDRLKSDGVDCSNINAIDGKSTAVAFVTYFEDGSRKFIFHIDGTPAVMVKSPDILDIENPRFFHIMGCSLMANEEFYNEIIATMEKFIDKGSKVSFDPNIRKELLGNRDIQDIIGPIMNKCSVLMPGVEELLLVTGEKTIESAVEKVLNNGITEIIALKQGSEGCTIYTRKEHFSLGVYKISPVDPTGAGDCFDAAFLCGLLEGKELKECAKLASAAAALNTAAFGPMEGKISIENIKLLMDGENINA
jgi:tagatose kinase